jgi:hypothetical protein
MSNTDVVVGTQGWQSRRSDLDVVAAGGVDFARRLESFAHAKDEATKALSQLRLGNDIIAMREDAQRKQQEALDVKIAAESYAAKVRREADEYATAIRKEADEHRQRGRDALDVATSHAEEAKQSAMKDRAAAKSALAAAKQTAAEAVELKQRHEQKVQFLQSRLAEIRGES